MAPFCRACVCPFVAVVITFGVRARQYHSQASSPLRVFTCADVVTDAGMAAVRAHVLQDTLVSLGDSSLRFQTHKCSPRRTRHPSATCPTISVSTCIIPELLCVCTVYRCCPALQCCLTMYKCTRISPSRFVASCHCLVSLLNGTVYLVVAPHRTPQ